MTAIPTFLTLYLAGALYQKVDRQGVRTSEDGSEEERNAEGYV